MYFFFFTLLAILWQEWAETKLQIIFSLIWHALFQMKVLLPLHYNWDDWLLVFELNYPLRAELWQMKLQRSSNSTVLMCGPCLVCIEQKHSSPSIILSVQVQCGWLIVWSRLGVHSMKHISPYIDIHTLACLLVLILNNILGTYRYWNSIQPSLIAYNSLRVWPANR